jgi:hypothetical protein
MSEIIHNNITKQGTSLDVAQNFTIYEAIAKQYTPREIRALVASEATCQKVVSFIASKMSVVDFSVKTLRKKRTKTIDDEVINTNRVLRNLIPWFQKAQIQANIVGKAYLVIDYHNPEGNDTGYQLVAPITWSSTEIDSLAAVEVLSGDLYIWSKSRKYLIKRGLAISKLDDSNIDLWLTKRRANSKALDLLDVIEESHILEFTAFDYQNDTDIYGNNYDNNLSFRRLNYNPISYRITRFISSLLRYLSFVSATLNRLHRSEAIVYSKDNLGENNLELSKNIAQRSGIFDESSIKASVTELIENELERVRASLTNFGITLIDKKNSVEMLARSMSGIDKLHDVFKQDLIASSGLTEFALLGFSSSGGGLASLDNRDRKAIATEVDEQFSNHWKPILQYLASSLLIDYEEYYSVEITQLKSFTLTELESADWLEKRVNVLLNLLDKGIIDKESIRKEILSNNALGNYFLFDYDDNKRLTALDEQLTTNEKLQKNNQET